MLVFLRNCPRAAQYGVDASKQFANRKRLSDVIVGAQFQSHDLVYFLSSRGQHDDRDRRPLALELFANIQPAHAGHHHVENDQVRRLAECALQACNAIRGRNDLVALELEVVAQPRHHIRFVFDNQDSRHIRFSNPARSGLKLNYCAASHCYSFSRIQANAALPLLCGQPKGNVIVNLLPAPGVLSTMTSPPCARAICCTSESPNPLPLVL